MKRNFFVSIMAHRVESAKAQKAYANIFPNDEKSLQGNLSLDKSLWIELFKNAKVDPAVLLTKLHLDSEQVLLALKDKRKSVRYTLLSNTKIQFTDEICDAILSRPWFSYEMAHHWLKSKTVPRSYLTRVANIENSSMQIELLADEELYTVDQAISILSQVSHFNSKTYLWKLFDLRPSLLPGAIALNDKNLFDAISGSRFLTEPSLIKKVSSWITPEEIKRSWNLRGVAYNLMINPSVDIETTIQINDIVNQCGPVSGDYRSSQSKQTHALRATFQKLGNIPGPLTKNSWELEEDPKVLEQLLRGITALGYQRYPGINDFIMDSFYKTRYTNSTPKEKVKYPHYSLDDLMLSDDNLVHYFNADNLSELTASLDDGDPITWEVFWTLASTWEGSIASLRDATLAMNQ